MEYPVLALFEAFACGAILGGLYLAALWGVLRRLASLRRPVPVLLTTTALRLGLLLASLQVVVDGRLERLAAAVLGFLLIRTIAITLVRRLGIAPPSAT